jgi:cobalamin biosynthesis protein CobD/CbiB
MSVIKTCWLKREALAILVGSATENPDKEEITRAPMESITENMVDKVTSHLQGRYS